MENGCGVLPEQLPSVPLSHERLAELKAVSEIGLSEAAEEMNLGKLGGYQEALLKVMADDLKKALMK